MPASIGGFVLFVVLLAPGFVYVWRRERLVPRASLSPFRETTEIVLASVAGGVTAVAGLAVVRVIFPGIAPDVGRFVREGGGYIKEDYRLVAVWTLVMILGACWCTFWAAGPKERTLQVLSRLRKPRPAATNGWVISPSSRWWEMFREEVRPGERVWVQCTLEDGTYLAGALGSFSAETDETGDRDLVLVGPVDYRGPGEDDVTNLDDVSVIVSAKRVLYLGVTYLHPQDAEVHEASSP